MNETFISYSRKDANFVSEIDESLREYGIDPWIDHEDIPAAVPWKKEMLLGVQCCSNFIFIISPDSISSAFCLEELECALRHNKRIVPILCRHPRMAFVHPALAELNWLFFDKDFEDGINKLIKVLELPRGCLGELDSKKSAILEILYEDKLNKTIPLYRSTYLIGRAPIIDSKKAGAIVLPDSSQFVSRIHIELRHATSQKQWQVVDRSKNGFLVYPPGEFLHHGSKIFVGSSTQLTYKEIERMEEEELSDDRPTVT